jgi:broad specificity phosphatase PhoE
MGLGLLIWSMRQLTLIRHALTEWNASGRVQGHSDIPLSPAGKAQAEALGERLAKLQVTAVYASPLKRSLETVHIALPERPVCLEARLMELDFGVFEGRTAEVNQRDEAWRLWHEDPYGRQAPGGESYRELRARVAEWLAELPAEGHLVAVTHSGTIQMLLAHVLGLEHPRWRKRIFLRHASITRILNEGEDSVIERVNDTRHLPAEEGDPFD